MRVKFTQRIALSLALVVMTCGVVHAEDCTYRDGGYCVSDIATKTAIKLGIPTEKAVWGKSKWGKAVYSSEGVLGGTDYLNSYENIWGQMVKDGKATMQDREKVFEEAKKAGGTKIGGVNLVVLGAGTLQQLVNKNILTKEKAQEILDKAR